MDASASHRIALGVSLLIAASALAQPAPRFEVASIKLSPARLGAAGLVAMDSDPAGIRYSNINLRILIAIAYRFNSNQIEGGPAWVDEQKYDVAAKLPEGSSKDQVPAMLEALLRERFRLAVHRESKEQRVYFLVVGSGGPRLKEKPPEDVSGAVQQVRGNQPQAQITKGRIIGHAIPVGTLAANLSQAIGYPVVDRTGLSKTYDVDLKWTPDQGNENGPAVLAAVQQQLGLKLESGKAPVAMLIIDRADRIPGEN